MEKLKEKLKRIKQKLFGTKRTAIISTVILVLIFSSTVFAAERVAQILNANDLSKYPKPQFDTGIGIHWDGSAGSNDAKSAQNNICTLKDIGVSWIKVMAGADSALDAAEVFKKNDIEPIIRFYRPTPNPGTLPQADIDAIKDYVAVGVSYFEPNNEPNLGVEWENGIPECRQAANQSMDDWVKDSLTIQKQGGHPLFPGLAPGGNCDDVEFLRNSFEWLKANTCTLANGQTGSCLDLFDNNKSNNNAAVMNVHNYSLDFDTDGIESNEDGFRRFAKYNGIVKEYLGRSIPILATEGGPTRDSGQAPISDNPQRHKDIIVSSANYQMNNKLPYFFNTAFWISHHTGNSDPGAKSQAWFQWGPKSSTDTSVELVPNAKFKQTTDALEKLVKKSRNGTPAPNSCSDQTVPPPTTQPPTTTTSCGVVGNLIKNCDMQQLTNGFPNFWVDGKASPRRAPNPNEQGSRNLKVVQINGGNALQIGKETNTCSLPLGPDDDFKLWSEARQDIPVGKANEFQLTFDLSLKSRTTSPGSSPFYIYAGFEPNQSNVTGGGKEIFLAYPTSQGDEQKFCSEAFKTSYQCVINSAPQTNCSAIATSPQKFTVDFSRQDICDNQSCVNNNTTLYLSFGVQNNFDTVATVDNVTLTSDAPSSPAPTTTPICGPATTQTPNPQTTPNPMECDESIGNRPEYSLSKNVTLKESMDNWTPFTFENAEVDHNTGGYTPFGPNILVTGSGNFAGGVYQTINNLKTGQWYQAFYATAQKMRGTNGKVDGGKATLREVGIDPTGGTDWRSSNIVWGRSVGGNTTNYGGWKTVEVGNSPLVSVRATGPSATMFVKVSGSSDNGGSETWINSPFFIEACEEAGGDNPLPTCGPTTPPNRTPTPTTRPGIPTPTRTTNPTPTVRPGTPTPTSIPGSCSVSLVSSDQTQQGYNLLNLSFSGTGGNVYLQMGQKGSKGTEVGNRYSDEGWFATNSVKGIGGTDLGKKKTTDNKGEKYNSTIVLVQSPFYENVFSPSLFQIYDWLKRYKKSPSIANDSPIPSDFIQGTDTAWWYLLDVCDGSKSPCERKNIQVKIPKDTRAWVFCSVRDQTLTSDILVCIGNPVCSYNNNGPDIGAQPDYACKAWRRSCSGTDFTSFTPTTTGLNVGNFTPTDILPR